jgi:pimeloyl-ACP methyl ester carboxylesterase
LTSAANILSLTARTTYKETTVPTTSSTCFLDRPGGRVAFDVTGEGPLVVCLPGMGEVRAAYRFLGPVLVAAGYRVATVDLRGHGESDASFDAYDDVAAGGDLLALVEVLGGPAVLVGTSMGAGAAAWAAAERPDLVTALVLAGPFVRDVPVGPVLRLALRLLLRRPWGPAAWGAYYGKLFPVHPPADLDEHRARLVAGLRRPAHWRAFVATTRTSHAPVEARLGEVRAPALVVMGDGDPDFPDPVAEAELVADRLDAELLVVPEAGHYPQTDRPDVVGPAVVAFLDRVHGRG